jgi:ribonuclease P protein component
VISTRLAVAPQRFRSEQHLRRPGEIRAVREQGRRVDCRAFTVWWKRREPAPTPASSATSVSAGETPAFPAARVCVIASTAAVGGATRRNRAKRRLREVFRHQQHLVPAGCDLLLIARAAATDSPLDELEQKFAEACRQIPPAAPNS